MIDAGGLVILQRDDWHRALLPAQIVRAVPVHALLCVGVPAGRPPARLGNVVLLHRIALPVRR